MRLFCIVDAKSESVCMTFSSINESTARRSFEDLIAAPGQTVFSLHAEDFSLYALGEVKCSFVCPTIVPEVQLICTGNDYSSAVLQTLREQRRATFEFTGKVFEEGVSSDGK